MNLYASHFYLTALSYWHIHDFHIGEIITIQNAVHKQRRTPYPVESESREIVTRYTSFFYKKINASLQYSHIANKAHERTYSFSITPMKSLGAKKRYSFLITVCIFPLSSIPPVRLYQLRPELLIRFYHIIQNRLCYAGTRHRLIQRECLKNLLIALFNTALYQQLFTVQLLHHKTLLE